MYISSIGCLLGVSHLHFFPETLTMNCEVFSSLILQMRKQRLRVIINLPVM